MIKFFRQIRRKLFSENQFSRYFFYAVGEIVLVVIGILIALQVNNWNETKKTTEIASDTQKNLIQELEEAKNTLVNTSEFNSEVIKQSGRYIYDSLSLEDYRQNPGKIFHLLGYAPCSFNVPILEQETGSNRRIYNDTLTDLLRKVVYEMEKVKVALFYLDEFWNGQVAPYYVKSKTMIAFDRVRNNLPVKLEIIKPLYEDEEFKNLVALSRGMTRVYLNSQKNMLKVIDKALTYMEKE